MGYSEEQEQGRISGGRTQMENESDQMDNTVDPQKVDPEMRKVLLTGYIL